MSTNKFKAITLGLLIASPLACADWCFNPHIGADFKHWGVDADFKDASRDYRSTFPDITAAGTFYIGTRINNNFGIDVGYDRARSKDKFRSYSQNQVIFGSLTNPGDTTQVDMELDAWWVSFLFYWEFYRNLEFVAHAGVASLQPKSTIIYYPVNPAAGPIDLQFKTRSKASGRFGFGLQYMFFKYFGARALVTWDSTSRINFVGNNQTNTPFDISPYKNAASFNVGLFAELS